MATELARGVPFHGRPGYETPWQDITTVAQCRQRLASLGMWPDAPHLDNGYVAWSTSGWVNAKGIFAWGHAHDADHLRQLKEIVAQTQTQTRREAGVLKTPSAARHVRG